jgi:surface carbohydrate biosynthesis protein
MRDIDVVYLYENVAREMDVACAIAAILRRRYGLSVEIVQWPQSVPRLYGRVRPRVVVLPFCYFEHSFDCLLEWRRAIYVNLAWEQLFYRGNVRMKTPKGTFAVNHVLHHAWSQDYAAFAREQSIPDEHIFLNGQPAYALYDEPYRRYFAQRPALAARHGLDAGRRWVFFPENYNWAFYPVKSFRSFVKWGLSPDQIQEMREFCTRSFREVMLWFAELARRSDVEVIVRPRPATPLEQFREAVEAAVPELPPSMHIIKAESVREWIMASDIVLSSHSTSLIEAAMAGRQAFMVTPFAVPASLHQEWHSLVPRIETEEGLFKTVLDVDGPSQSRPLEAWARSKLMSRGDPVDRLAAYLATVATGQVARPPVPSWHCVTAQGEMEQVPKWIWFVFRRLRARLRRIVPPSADLTRLSEFVSADEIERRIRRWEEILQSEPSLVEGVSA